MSERTNDLTVRQGDVLDVIAAQLHSRAQVPTYKEIGEALGITSTHGVYCHVRALRKKGYLHPSEGKSRGLRLTRKGLGRIRRQAAALPRHASQVGTTVYIDGRLGGADTVVYQLSTESAVLFDNGLAKGDLCIVHLGQRPSRGDLVLLMEGGQLQVCGCVRTLRPRPSASPATPAVLVDFADGPRWVALAQVEGVLIAVLRDLHGRL